MNIIMTRPPIRCRLCTYSILSDLYRQSAALHYISWPAPDYNRNSTRTELTHWSSLSSWIYKYKLSWTLENFSPSTRLVIITATHLLVLDSKLGKLQMWTLVTVHWAVPGSITQALLYARLETHLIHHLSVAVKVINPEEKKEAQAFIFRPNPQEITTPSDLRGIISTVWWQ